MSHDETELTENYPGIAAPSMSMAVMSVSTYIGKRGSAAHATKYITLYVLCIGY